MNRYIAIFLMSISVNAIAGWVEITKTQTNSFYYDPTTMKRTGNIIRVWRLRDNISPIKNGAYSSRMLVEVDCDSGQQRTIEYSYHTGHMGDGEIIERNTTVSQWFLVPTLPNTVQEISKKLFCQQ